MGGCIACGRFEARAERSGAYRVGRFYILSQQTRYCVCLRTVIIENLVALMLPALFLPHLSLALDFLVLATPNDSSRSEVYRTCWTTKFTSAPPEP